MFRKMMKVAQSTNKKVDTIDRKLTDIDKNLKYLVVLLFIIAGEQSIPLLGKILQPGKFNLINDGQPAKIEEVTN